MWHTLFFVLFCFCFVFLQENRLTFWVLTLKKWRVPNSSVSARTVFFFLTKNVHTMPTTCIHAPDHLCEVCSWSSKKQITLKLLSMMVQKWYCFKSSFLMWFYLTTGCTTQSRMAAKKVSAFHESIIVCWPL